METIEEEEAHREAIMVEEATEAEEDVVVAEGGAEGEVHEIYLSWWSGYSQRLGIEVRI